jgi:hypothetical protein
MTTVNDIVVTLDATVDRAELVALLAAVASTSLADLAARIRAEHEAASAALNSGLRHATEEQ